MLGRQINRVIRHFRVMPQRLFTSKASAQQKLKSDLEEWESVVGLEIHVQIKSKSKLFSSAPSQFGAAPNSQVSPFDAALPGTLPVLNQQCVKAAVLTALALNCDVQKVSSFDRKHYFYADLPAGYQITQQRHPIALNGHLDFIVLIPETQKMYLKSSKIKQLQLEQDSGKSLHDAEYQRSLIDLNRAGIGLMEIVFEPDLSNGEEAAHLVKELQLILRALDTCSCKMEEGAIRVDANVSVNRPGEPLGIRTEIKNINSIRAVANAVDYEIQRQIDLKTQNKEIVNMTMMFDSEKRITVPMRDKEVVQDYRFMPEPNLPPLVLSDGLDDQETDRVVSIPSLKKTLPPLPASRREYLKDTYGLQLREAMIIVNEDGLFEYFEAVMQNRHKDVKKVVNLLLIDILGHLNRLNLSFAQCPVDVSRTGKLVHLICSGHISTGTKSKVLELMFDGDTRKPEEIVDSNNWRLITDAKELEEFCRNAMEKHPDKVIKYKRGKVRALNALMAEIRIQSSERADMRSAKEILIKLVEQT